MGPVYKERLIAVIEAGMFVPTPDQMMRLVMATLVGSLIGLNRDLHGKPAGLRTHALVALGSALIVMVCEELPGAGIGTGVSDAQSRAIQGLLTGIGFLGGGVILRSVDEKRVHGLTTAAAIWVAALFGAATGAGAYPLVMTGFALLALILLFGGTIERTVNRRLRPKQPPMPPPPDA